MDFASSKSGFNANVKTVSATGSGGLNFKSSGGGFSANVNTVSVGQLNQIYDEYEEIDYSKGLSEEVVAAVTGENAVSMDGSGSSSNDNRESTIFTESFLIDKGINTVAWASSKWIIGDLASGMTKSSNGFVALAGLTLVALGEGGYKYFLKDASYDALGKDKSANSAFFSGITKSLGSTLPKNWNAIKDAISKVPVVKNLVSSKAIEEVAKKAAGDSIFPTIDSVKVFKSNKGFFKGFTGIMNGTTLSYGQIVSKMKLGIGIDFGASLLANAVAGCFDENGEFSFSNFEVSDLKVGSSFLKSTTKIIFATAGEIAFGKAGKVAGTVVGSFLGEVQVEAFKDENGNIQEGWCAAAGAFELGGAVIGGAVVVACMSNPVGWAVGLGIIAGAIVGYGLVFAAHAVAENWDEITGWVADTWNAGVEFVSEKLVELGETLENIGEALVEVKDATVEYIAKKIDEAEEFVEELAESAVEVKDAVVDYVSEKVEDVGEAFEEFAESAVEVYKTVGQAVKSNRIANCLFGWAF